MKIEAGKYYRTRGGDVVGPMKPVTVANDAPHPRYVWGCFGRTWTDSGDYDFGAGYLEEDLISEVYVIDTPPSLSDRATVPFKIMVPEAKTPRDELEEKAALAILKGYYNDATLRLTKNGFAEIWREAEQFVEARKK
jgi:hypothetical protein